MSDPGNSSYDFSAAHADAIRKDLQTDPRIKALASAWPRPWRNILNSRWIRRVLRGLDVMGAVLIRTRLGAHFVYLLIPGARPLVCSNCLKDTGLRLDAEACGIVNALACPHCGSKAGRRLTKYLIDYLMFRFFVRGSVTKFDYGAAPELQFNKHRFRKGDYKPSTWLEGDLSLLTDTSGTGVFHYGPRAWMCGEVYPLKDLQNFAKRRNVIVRILGEYPSVDWPEEESFFRVRVNPDCPEKECEYDSPPATLLGKGRLDSATLPILYCSQDIEGCIHECRVTAEDEVYAATLTPTRPLNLLDLTVRLNEPFNVTEFNSLDMAVHMLFSAGPHSYEISRAIALAAQVEGFDGLLFPSYFSQLRSGRMPFETTLGMSWRRLPGGAVYSNWGMFPNVCLFGRPIAERLVQISCVNRVVLSRVMYKLSYGPVLKRS